MKLTKGVVGLFDRILDYLTIFAGFLVAFMMLAVTFEVIMRSIGHPTMWVQEIVEISLLYVTFLAIAAVARKGAHVKMDAVFNRLRPRVQAFLNIIFSIITVIIGWVFLWYGTKVTWSYFERDLHELTMLELPIAPILIVIPIGGFLMVLQFLRQTWREIDRWKTLSHQEGGS